MENRLKLSVIIVNFNSYQFLKASLESIEKSDFSKSMYEVIVADNASSEKISNFKFPISNFKYIENKKNIGFAKANNQVIKEARGDYVLLLNPDTLLQKETLDVMLDYMVKNPAVGIATCRMELPSGKLDDACHRGFPTPWNALCHFTGISKLFPTSLLLNGYHLGYRNLDQVHEIDSCVGAFMLIRRKVGDTLHWLDEDYFWYGEDIDFCYRAKQAGWKVMFVPATKIIHYKGVSSGIKKHSQDVSTADKATRQLATKARFDVMRIFYRKHYMQKYPSWLTWFVLRGVDVMERIH